MSFETPMLDQPTGFCVAPFAIDGELEGIGFWDFGKLSEKWLGICRSILEHYAESFEMPWEGNLSHISTKVTAASGAALVTFRVHGAILSSIALLSGAERAVENDVLRMFAASLKGVQLTQLAAKSAEPFQKLFSIEERPLMVVVPWPRRTISESDFRLAKELAIHLAAAFFQKGAR
jgi:hypothetical protein